MSCNAKNMLKMLQRISFVSDAAAVFSRISKCLSAPGWKSADSDSIWPKRKWWWLERQKCFKTGVESIPMCDSIFRHLFNYYSTSGLYFLSLSDPSRWSMAKVPSSFPKLSFSSWCRSGRCNPHALPWQSELPVPHWTSGWARKECRGSSFGKMRQPSSVVAASPPPMVCRLFPHYV